MVCCGQKLSRHLQGAEHILHAGDVGDPEILPALNKIAPTTAIRGNIDEGGACGASAGN